MKRSGRPKFLKDTPGGYLLVEVLIATAIFAIGFLAVGTLVISTTQNNTTGNITTQATLLAVETMELLKSTPDITTLSSSTAPETVGGIFSRSWTVSDPLGFNTSRQIEVTVSWNRLGQNRRVVLRTITKGGGI
jgi:hypothetical protein